MFAIEGGERRRAERSDWWRNHIQTCPTVTERVGGYWIGSVPRSPHFSVNLLKMHDGLPFITVTNAEIMRLWCPKSRCEDCVCPQRRQEKSH